MNSESGFYPFVTLFSAGNDDDDDDDTHKSSSFRHYSGTCISCNQSDLALHLLNHSVFCFSFVFLFDFFVL